MAVMMRSAMPVSIQCVTSATISGAGICTVACK